MSDTAAITVASADGHRWSMPAVQPASPRADLLWLPALGVSARHYLPLAEALAAHGVATYLHEWRGHGSSSLRASRQVDWGFAALLGHDLPAALDAMPARGQRPLLLGGHSLGGQLACCFAGQMRPAPEGLWLVASGTPYWRTFPGIRGSALPLVYRFLPWLARRNGSLPGRRLGFGGREARGLVADWAKVGLCDRYAATGLDTDLEAGMAALRTPVHGVCLDGDWLAPASSLLGLFKHMPSATHGISRLGPDDLGTRADHFSWMRAPTAIAAALADTGITRESGAAKETTTGFSQND